MAGEADEAAREFGQFFRRGRAFALRGAQLHARDEPAEVAVAFAGGRQQHVAGAVGAGDFRADVRAHPGFARRHVKARRAIDAVAVRQPHRRHAVAGAGGDQVFRKRSAFQKTESGAGVEFGVHEAVSYQQSAVS